MKLQDQLAIERFVEYIQIKTVQPQPDYDSSYAVLETIMRMNWIWNIRSSTIDRRATCSCFNCRVDLLDRPI